MTIKAVDDTRQLPAGQLWAVWAASDEQALEDFATISRKRGLTFGPVAFRFGKNYYAVVKP